MMSAVSTCNSNSQDDRSVTATLIGDMTDLYECPRHDGVVDGFFNNLEGIS
jgi:hypothetical protein